MTDAEREIVEGLRRGDEAACRVLLTTQGPRLLAVARRLVGEHDAADALQDAMLNALRQIQSFRGEARLATWLHRITVNACLARMRRAHTRLEGSIEDLLPEFDTTGHRLDISPGWPELPEDAAARHEIREVVRRCVARLPDGYREVFVLRDVEGLAGVEVADMTGLSTNAVKIRLHRARQALRTMVEAELKGSEAWL
ncbi:MAG: sigma-70 family RNA polymerase sigma factor [Gammaproteobacteria bacterium]|nr:sigma-70 family RNA polymerase sigma factor [Gammaproteobacteria bacterium]